MVQLSILFHSVLLIVLSNVNTGTSRHTSRLFSERLSELLPFPTHTPNKYDCSCNETEIWLDVMFLFSSSNMDKNQYIGATGYWAEGLENMNIQKEGYNRSSLYIRTGLIEYNQTVTTRAKLGQYNRREFIDIINKIDYIKTTETNLADAIKAAFQEFERVPSDNIYRRKIIFIISSFFNVNGVQAPEVIAQQFRESGGIIAVFNMINQFEIIDETLMQLASPGYYIDSRKQSHKENEITLALCDANCFCGPNWYSSSTDHRNKPLGGCLRPFNTPMSDINRAAANCQQLGHEGIIAVDKDLNTSNFFWQQFDDDGAGISWIGLEYDSAVNKVYRWSDGSHLSGSYHPWNNYQEPGPSMTKYCVIRVQNNGITNWTQVPCAKDQSYQFICQIMPCDATSGGYCGPNDFI